MRTVLSTKDDPYNILAQWPIWHALIIHPPQRAPEVFKLLQRVVGPYFPQPYFPRYRIKQTVKDRNGRVVKDRNGRSKHQIVTRQLLPFIFVPHETFTKFRSAIDKIAGIELLRADGELSSMSWLDIRQIISTNVKMNNPGGAAKSRKDPRFKIGAKIRLKSDLGDRAVKGEVAAIEKDGTIHFDAPFMGRMTRFVAQASQVEAV
jgi:hypothetical protein